MRGLAPYLLTVAVAYTGLVNADVVVNEASDTTLGKGVGAWAGVLVGGAVGGPLGAVAAGLAGAWTGGQVQESSGLSGTAYLVERDDGSEVIVRSPKREWSRGDKVEIVGNRLIPSIQ